MSVLILHHFQHYWEPSLVNCGTSFDECMKNACWFIIQNRPDKVIVTLFEQNEADGHHSDLIDLCEAFNIEIEFINYDYGWYYDEEHHTQETFGTEWCWGTRDHHTEGEDIVLIEQWMHDLDDEEIWVGGAFVGECLCDLETALSTINKDPVLIDELCVGY